MTHNKEKSEEISCFEVLDWMFSFEGWILDLKSIIKSKNYEFFSIW
jgi:hypothetical protein